MMSLPTYKIANGMADFIMRSSKLKIIIEWLVSHTSLKKRGRFFMASSRSWKVSDAFLVFIGGLLKVRKMKKQN
jgi:hypothetical protein